MRSVYTLAENRSLTLFSGAIFAVMPNLTESFNWHTMSAYTLGIAGYLAELLIGGAE